MKIGTIGTGFIVDTFIEAIHTNSRVDVLAIYSRTQESADAFARKHNVTKAYTDLDAMFADKDIDTIYVASPNSVHFSQTLQALKAKKHVICEKPFTSTVKELDILIAEAKKQGVFLWEAITNIHIPNLNIVKDNLSEVGNIRLVTCNFSQYSSRYAAYKEGALPNVFTPTFSGGALVDINLYNIHLCMHLFGTPKSYKYYPNKGANGIDTSGVMIFTYDTFVATLIGAKDSASNNFACIQGDEGSLLIDGSNPGICKNVTLTKTLGKTEHKQKSIGVEQNQYMTYELAAFETMLSQQDFTTCHRLLEYSREVLTLVESARKEAGIIFDADRQISQGK